MVARPSLKRVVPGSIPPWRALCAESARALKAFFSFLCVSKSVLLLESEGGPGLVSSCERVFFAAPSLFRAAATFSWQRRGFPLPAIKKARQPFVMITLDPLSEHFRGRNALGFARRRTSKLAGRCS